MTNETLSWLAECALRSLVLASAAGLAVALFRVRNAASQSLVWTAVLLASLAMPAVSWLAPPLRLLPTQPAPAASLPSFSVSLPATPAPVSAPATTDWLAVAYLAVVSALLLRLGAGVALGMRLRRRSAPIAGFDGNVLESYRVSTPATYGIYRPFVVLPSSWRNWEQSKLNAVVLHEFAHIERRDFAVQLLATLHAAIFWFSPMAWWLRARLATLAEHASDDCVVARTGDRVYYAEVLLAFLGQHKTDVAFDAVPMARPGDASRRIERILDGGRHLSTGISRVALAVITAIAGPLVYLAASVSFAQAPVAPVPPVPAPAAMAFAPPAPPTPPAPGAQQRTPPTPPVPPPAQASSYRARGNSELVDIEENRIHFKKDGNWDVITDPALVAKAKSLEEPMRVLGEQQRALGERQRALGEEQRRAGEKMRDASVRAPDLRMQMEKLSKTAEEARAKQSLSQTELGQLQQRASELQQLISKTQGAAAARQSEIGKEMNELGARQSALGQQQSALGAQQSEAARKAGDQLRDLLDEAVKDSKAKPIE